MKEGDIYLAMIKSMEGDGGEEVRKRMNDVLLICNEVFPGTSYREEIRFEPKFIYQNDNDYCEISIWLLDSATNKYIASEIIHCFASLKVDSAAKRLANS